MRVKIALLEKDKSYLTRIMSTFGTKYADKLEVYSFTDPEVALGTLSGAKIDLLLASDAFNIDVSKLPNRCAFAYLVDSMGIEMLNDQRAICKFQRADLIYKQILSIYSEKASSITGFNVSGEEGHVLLFASPSGGVGSSTMAAACAMRFAKQGKKVLYLNMETFGTSEVFFRGEGQFDMHDIIFALKSKKTNLSLKLESCVKQDPCGVYYYAESKVALDMMELSVDDSIRLLSELKLTGSYNYIIIDAPFGLSKDMLNLYRQARAIVLVGNGSEESNNKIERAYAAMSILEASSDAPLNRRTCFMYNKVSSKGAQQINAEGMKVLGGAPCYTGVSVRQIVEQLATMEMFDAIV